jgi:hypothetical protein
VLKRNPWYDALRQSKQFRKLVERAKERFDEADEAYRSVGGPQLLSRTPVGQST